MLRLKDRAIGFCLGFILILALTLHGFIVAFADSTTGTATINAGTLTETNASTPTVSATPLCTSSRPALRPSLG